MTKVLSYRVAGMTCQGCVAEIEAAVKANARVDSCRVSLNPPLLTVVLRDSQHDSPSLLQEISQEIRQGLPSRFKLEGPFDPPAAAHSDGLSNPENGRGSQVSLVGIGTSGEKLPEQTVPAKSLATYWPLLLVLGYILLGTGIAMAIGGNWSWSFGMQMFMGLFFAAFSFFKLLDLPGFANAYRGYDWVARVLPGYGYVYPFIELILGICYLLGAAPLLVNWVTLVVMSISIGGVIESVLRKKAIRCACLGTGFNLPMSQVTIIEDGVMIAMAATMIVQGSL